MDPTALDPAGRWRLLAIVAAALLLAFAPWFSASAVGPLLQADWQLGRLDLPFLTIAVQLGFAAGALVLAASGAADVIPARSLMAGGAVAAAIANLGFATVATDTLSAIPFRLATGAALACVYPVAIKVVAGWFRRERGRRRRRARRRAHDRVGAAVPVPRGRRDGRCRLARRRGAAPASPPSSAGSSPWRACATGPATSGRRGSASRRRARAFGRRLGAPREPRLPRAHVGALRDVDVGPAVHRRELRRRRAQGRVAGQPRRVPGGRLGRARVRRGRARRRSGGPDDGHDGGDGLQRRQRAGDRVPVRAPRRG